MSEKEKKILETFGKVIPDLSEMEQLVFLTKILKLKHSQA